MRPGRAKDWTEAEEARLCGLARRRKDAAEIARVLGRPVASVRRKARTLGVLLYKKFRKPPGTSEPRSPAR